MRTSGIGSLVLYLHEKAREEGRLVEEDEDALLLLLNLKGVVRPCTTSPREHGEAAVAGLELRSGTCNSPLAVRVREAALLRLEKLDIFLDALDHIGYTPQLVKAALEHHYKTLATAPPGTDENCIYLDLQLGVERLVEQGWRPLENLEPEATRNIVSLLAQGHCPDAIGAILKTNGSRLIGRVVKALSVVLEGGRYATRGMGDVPNLRSQA